MTQASPPPGSTLRRQFLLAGTLLWLVLGGIQVLLARQVLGAGFEQVEAAEAQANLRRAQAALEVDHKQLLSLTREWATWDDCFELAGGVDNSFVEDNMHADALSRLRASEILFLNRKGEVVTSIGQDEVGGPTRPTNLAWNRHIKEPPEYRTGFAEIAGRPYAWATAPLQPSAGSAEPTGVLLMARRLDTLTLSSLAETSAQRLELGPPGSIDEAIHLTDSAEVIAESPIVGESGEVIRTFRVIDDRPIRDQAVLTQRVLLIWLSLSTFLIIAVALAFTETRVLVPIRALEARLNDFGRGESRLPRLTGSRELYALSLALEGALDARKAAQEAQQRQLTAEQVSEARGTFLARMSHELRTPMNGILGTMELLDHTNLDVAQRRLVDTVRSSARTLLLLINDVLDLSRIDAGRLSLELSPTTIGRLVEEVAELLGPIARQRGLQLFYKVDVPEKARLMVDALRLRQVLLNLLGNALKYTQQGTVEVISRKNADHLVIQVKDSGPGIDPEVQSRIFEPFMMGTTGAPPARAQASLPELQSTGLGLSICRELIRLMDGELELQSKLGEGSVFTVRIPWIEAKGEEILQRAPPLSNSTDPKLPHRNNPPSRRQYGLNILVVEDNPVNQVVAEGMLRLFGCHIFHANDGQAALDILQKESFDLVFMDCHMPVLDGLEATRQLRKREEGGRRTPIVALTANAMAGDAASCLEAGMDDFLSKPLSLDALSSMLERWEAHRIPHAADKGA